MSGFRWRIRASRCSAPARWALRFDMYEAGERQDVYSLEPFYLRETQAERVYAEKQRSAT